ncbi:MAG: hypothetical protein D6776_05380 [Planctomycetota bacterium]|nr:MAG: hypothetical protein D6776_05380 [Planctomycetota bacterium]
MLGYDITIEVEGSYDQPEITLASVPALEQTDLLTLLLTGRPPREDQLGRTGLRAGRAIALYVAKDVLAALLDSESAEAGESLLDRLTLEFGRDVTRSGGETIEARFRIADHWLTSRDTVYLTAEQDAYDHFGGGLRLVFRFR